MDASPDMGPNVPSEKLRIELAGGVVESGRIGLFALSRALGANPHKELVSPVPHMYDTGRPCEYVILACDGLWDAPGITYEIVYKFVTKSIGKMSVDKIAEDLVKFALAEGSTDNVSVIIYVF
jgi:serine/threonine protein phosphatase PrpC